MSSITRYPGAHLLLNTIYSLGNFNNNKTVLLRECKRHTTRRVASTRSVIPVGGGGGGVPTLGGGYPPHPDLGR